MFLETVGAVALSWPAGHACSPPRSIELCVIAFVVQAPQGLPDGIVPSMGHRHAHRATRRRISRSIAVGKILVGRPLRAVAQTPGDWRRRTEGMAGTVAALRHAPQPFGEIINNAGKRINVNRSSHPLLSCTDGIATGISDLLLLIGRVLIACVFLMTVWTGGPSAAYLKSLNYPAPEGVRRRARPCRQMDRRSRADPRR